MSNFSKNLSGVVFNQNAAPTNAAHFATFASTSAYYQDFYLPANYARGTDADRLIPPLTGFQFLLKVASGASLTTGLGIELSYKRFGYDWAPLGTAQTVGTPADGDKVWIDLYFDEPIEITEDMLDDRFRIKVVSIAGGTTVDPSGIWYTSPNPLALSFTKAYQSDGFTPVTASSVEASFLFRVLGLVADDGVDFLGNSYRSAVLISSVDNASTISGDVEDKFWMSKPNPSRFAVENLYFDVRKQAALSYGPSNLIPYPNFETGITGWSNLGTATGASLTSDTTFFISGTKSARLTATATANQSRAIYPTTDITAKVGRTYHARGTFKGAASNPVGSTAFIQIDWYNGVTYLSSSNGTAVSSVGNTAEVTITATAPASTTKARVLFYNKAGGSSGTLDISWDNCALIEGGTVPYFDGNYQNCAWSGTKNASESVQIVTDVEDTASVIDQVLVDPVTPGVFFNVYYTSEGDPGTSEDDWDNKLWKKVPGTFQANRRESHVFPSPVIAKYLKVEFTNLQAKSYSPGDLAREVTYKKHPKWVLDYFLSRLNERNSLEARLMHKRVGVVFDGYDLAYNYYLDDLNQEPEQPVEIRTRLNVLDDYIKTTDLFIDQVDLETATKIKIAFKPFQSSTSSWFNDDLLGQVAAYNTPSNGVGSEQPLELDNVDFSDTLALRNTDVAFENDVPAMFFFVTCRHKYRELLAKFTHNRAYFVGVKQIAFGRQNYSTTHDSDQYIEPSGDLLNMERNDFVQNDGVLVAGFTQTL